MHPKKHAHIAPSSTLCGNVTIGEKSLIGAGTIVIPNTVIGNNVIVGAGSVIIKNINDNKSSRKPSSNNMIDIENKIYQHQSTREALAKLNLLEHTSYPICA